MDANERLRSYRRYVYEAGAVDRSEFGQRKVIGEMVVEKERKKELKFGFSQNCGMRSVFSVDVTDQKLKSSPDPLFMPNIPLKRNATHLQTIRHF
jgi:hypothetical protein